MEQALGKYPYARNRRKGIFRVLACLSTSSPVTVSIALLSSPSEPSLTPPVTEKFSLAPLMVMSPSAFSPNGEKVRLDE